MTSYILLEIFHQTFLPSYDISLHYKQSCNKVKDFFHMKLYLLKSIVHLQNKTNLFESLFEAHSI